MNNKNIFLNLLLLTFLFACNGKNGTNVDIEQKQPRPLNTTLTSVNVVNDQLIIRGTGLSSVTRVQLTGSGTTGTYDVVSATANEIVVNAASAVVIGVGRTLDLLISNAEAQASYSITFDLNNNAVLSQHINDMGASAGQVLKFNGTNWVPGSLPSSQLYLGSFDANNNVPDLSSPSSQAGDYYIVSVAGTFNSIAYDVGDWIISDGVAWQRIANAAPAVTSFEGRQGAVVLAPGDYVSLLDTTTQKLIGSSLEDIADVDTTGIAANKILKFDGSAWVIADDLVGGGAGSVGTTELQNTSVTYAKMNLTDGDVPQAKISGLVTAFTSVNTSLSGKIGLGNLSATAPLAYNNGTGAFTISAASTTAAGTLSATDKTKLDSLEALSAGDGLLERFSGVLRSNTCTAGQILKWNAVSGWTCSSDSNTDTTKLPLAGGTMTGNLVLDTHLQLKDGATANYVTLKAPAAGTASYTLTFPPTVGAANQVLTTNASGVLSWTSVGTATSVGGDLTGTVANASIATDAITTGKVLDGTLLNADINVAAGIAQSKIANLTTDLSTINTSLAGKIGLTSLSATAPLVYDNTTGAFTVNAATTALPGTLSAADKTKLDIVSGTELGYLAGATSDLQGQLDDKLNESGGTLTGNLIVNTEIQLKDGSANNYVTLKAPASGTTSYSLTFPATVGANNQVLTTNASGVLSWTTVATGSTAVGGDLSGTITSATIVADAVTSGKVLDGTLVNADINASAAIAQSKIANLTTDLSTITTNVAGKIGLTALTATAPLVYNNTTGAFTVNAATTALPGSMSAADKTKLDSVSTTELDYLVGVSSDIQTQIDTKFAKAGGTLSGDLLLDTQLRLKDGSAANYVTLKAPASGTTSYTLTFPAAVGALNQVLTTNASGVLSWTTVATSGTSVGGDLTGTIASATIAADAVTSGKVLDGTLVNADINASAAIAQSKIANLTTDLSTITTNVAGKIGLTSLSATAPLVYNNTTGAFTIDAASTTAPGSLSAADKTKLNALEALSAGDGIFERFSGVVRSNTCSANEVLKWNVVSGWTCGADNATDATKLPLAGGTLTGNLIVNTEIQLKDGAAANYVTLRAPASGTTSYTLTFPAAVGANNQVLTTNASGVLSWTTVATSGTAVGGDLTGTIASATIAADAVTSAKIIDGTLVNADINAAAAIAQSKIANLTTDLSTITTNVAGKIGLTALSATAPLVYNNTTGAFTVNAATTALPGSMSAADKTKLDTVSTTELDYLVGVTSDVQTQIDTKFAKAGGTLTGDLLLDTQLRLKDGAAANYVTLKAPASGTTSYTLTFPAAVGSANQVLTTNASGVLSWTTVGTSTAVGGDLTGTVANAVIAADAVTSAKIVDGTLVNADINASAAIAQSKIANLTTDLSTITTNVAGKIGLTALSATAPLVYNNTTGAFTIDAASTTAPGSLSAADKTKLNGLEALSAGDGIFERFSGVVRSNTCSANEVLKWNVVSGWTCGADNATDATKLPLAGGTLTGNLIVNTEIQLKDGAAANYVTLKAPASGTTSYTLTFPSAVGSNNQVLTTNASGVLSWTTVATSGTAVGGDLTGTIASATIAADAVTSAKIIDGTLVNADINAAAAIAQSKISNLTTDLSTITTNVAGKIGLTALSATAPLVYNNTTGAFTVNAATTALPGSMSAADKTKLDVVSSTELDYLAGVTSDIQTQADAKLPKAGGTLTGDLTLETELKLKDGASANYVNLRAPASGTSSYTLTFPAAVGSANQVLTTNASGVLSWTTIGTATSVGGDLTGTVANAVIAADAVTSAKIIDGTLVNADINAAAAIAQSKVANLVSDLSTITTNVAGKIGLTALSATAPLVYNNTTGAFTMNAATTALPGSMSAADKTKLDVVSSTELDYLAGVSSDVQTQIDTKFAKAGGTLTGDLTLETELKLKDGASANYVNLRAPASGTSSYTLTFPAAVGSANQVLTTSAAGVLSWTTIGTSTSVGGDLTGTVANAVVAGDAITSAKIADGAIVDADINASAAIAQSKVANLTTDLAGKIGLTALSATAPLVYSNTTGAFTVNAATTALPGSMSAADKTKIDALEILSAGNGLFERFSGSIESNTCTAGQVLAWNAVAGWACSEVVSGVLGTVTPSNVAIATGDIIGDAFNKAQGQIEAKANIAAPTFTGIPRADTAAVGNNSTQLATTAFVTAATPSLVMLASDQPNTLAAYADVTGLSFNVTSGITYEYEFFIVYNAAGGVGSRWSINGPATVTPGFLNYESSYSISSTTAVNNFALAAYNSGGTAASSIATGNIAQIKGIIRSSADGVVIARSRSGTAGSAITALAGRSYVKYKIISP